MVPHPVQVSAGRPGAAGPARTSTHPAGLPTRPVPAQRPRGRPRRPGRLRGPARC